MLRYLTGKVKTLVLKVWRSAKSVHKLCVTDKSLKKRLKRMCFLPHDKICIYNKIKSSTQLHTLSSWLPAAHTATLLSHPQHEDLLIWGNISLCSQTPSGQFLHFLYFISISVFKKQTLTSVFFSFHKLVFLQWVLQPLRANSVFFFHPWLFCKAQLHWESFIKKGKGHWEPLGWFSWNNGALCAPRAVQSTEKVDGGLRTERWWFILYETRKTWTVRDGKHF